MATTTDKDPSPNASTEEESLGRVVVETAAARSPPPTQRRRIMCDRCGRPRSAESSGCTLCEALPSQRLPLHPYCHVLAIQHPSEIRHSNRSLFVVELCYQHVSRIVTRKFYHNGTYEILGNGHQKEEKVKKEGESTITSDHISLDTLMAKDRPIWVLYPHPTKAKPLSQVLEAHQQMSSQSATTAATSIESTVATPTQAASPITLIVFDATWKYAAEMFRASTFPTHAQFIRLDKDVPQRSLFCQIRTPPSKVPSSRSNNDNNDKNSTPLMCTAECLAWVVSQIIPNSDSYYETVLRPLNALAAQWHRPNRAQEYEDKNDSVSHRQAKTSSNANENPSTEVMDDWTARTSVAHSNTRKRKGRAARRRQQRRRDVFSSSSATAAATSTSQNNSSLSDRSVRPAVLTLRHSFGWKRADQMAVIQQLGTVPTQAVRVACRVQQVLEKLVSLGLPPLTDATFSSSPTDPVVLQLYPLAIADSMDKDGGSKRKRRKGGIDSSAGTAADTGNDTSIKHEEGDIGVSPSAEAVAQHPLQSRISQQESLKPFPTMYWLTHPQFKLWVSQLEVASLGVQFEKQLQNESEAQLSMKQAHQAYGHSRWELLTVEDQQEVRRRQWTSAIDGSKGVAGIRNPAAVKCLHAHLAHYLSGDAGSQHNVVGAWVLKAIPGLLLPPRRCEHQDLNSCDKTDSHFY